MCVVINLLCICLVINLLGECAVINLLGMCVVNNLLSMCLIILLGMYLNLLGFVIYLENKIETEIDDDLSLIDIYLKFLQLFIAWNFHRYNYSIMILTSIFLHSILSHTKIN